MREVNVFSLKINLAIGLQKSIDDVVVGMLSLLRLGDCQSPYFHRP